MLKIQITETDLHGMVMESVKRILSEMTEYYRKENGLNENNADDEALFDRVRNLKPTDEMPDEYYDWEDEWMEQGLADAKIEQVTINVLEEIFPGEYDSERIVDGNEISYTYDTLGTPEEREDFFNYCKDNEYLSHVVFNVKAFDDGIFDSIEREDEIINYINQYPDKKFVKYFMDELECIKDDMAEFVREPFDNEDDKY